MVKESKCSTKDVDNALWGYGKYVAMVKREPDFRE